MLKIKQVEFVKSITDYRQRPYPKFPEFAFAGRSNVGKSALINRLLNRKNIARVSKKPGKTRTINFLNVNHNFYLVDLPGYGFAKVGAAEKKQWGTMIEGYLLNSDALIMLYVLIDSVVGLQKNDYQLFEWLVFHGIPFYLIATKSDRLSKTAFKKREAEIKRNLKIENMDAVIPFSAKTGTGREVLLNHIQSLLNNPLV